jgi:hypothetical protein
MSISSEQGRGAYVVRSEADLVAMVPVLLGFHPEESVVLLTFSDRPGSFHARVDLPRDADHQRDVTDLLVDACRTNRVGRAAVVIYAQDHEVALRQTGILVAGLCSVDVEVLDVLRVGEGQWFSLWGEDAGAPVGTPLALSSHRFTARAVFEGRAIQRDRQQVRQLLSGRADDPERARIGRAASWRCRLVEGAGSLGVLVEEAWWLRDRLQRAVREQQPLDTADAARVLGLVLHHDLRDVAWVDLRRGNAREHVEVWLDLLRRSPEELVPGASSVLALAAYVAGDGALAWCAVERCHEVAPHHSLARLVGDLLTAARSPHDWPDGDPSALPLLALGRPRP